MEDLLNDALDEDDEDDDANKPKGRKPDFSNNQAAAWVNESKNGDYVFLNVKVATGSFVLFPQGDHARKALEYIKKGQED